MNSNYNGLANSVFDPNASSYNGYNDYTTSQYKRPSFLDSIKTQRVGQNNALTNTTDNMNKSVTMNTDLTTIPGSQQTQMLNDQWSFNPSSSSSSSSASTGIMGNLTDWFGKQGNLNMMQGALGLGNLGLGLASYLQQSQYLKKQGNLLDQQISNNAYEMNQRKRMNDALDAQHV